MNVRLSLALAFVGAFAAVAAPKAPAAKSWERLDDVRYKAQRYDDGDSFHITTADGRELIVRLYFVDCSESERKYADRVADQAAYFGVSEDQSLALGRKATEFTRQALARPFKVWTRWHDAMGRSQQQRFYAVVLTADGEDLAKELVRNGLARIYGSKAPLPDGKTSKAYIAELSALESEAKAAKRGGWETVRK